MKRSTRFTLSSAVALAVAGVIPSTAAVAQESAGLEEVVVTARKRDESLQEIPVAVSVFGADDILMTDMRDLEDVALHTPGFQFMNQGNQQPGRYNTQLQFRGLTTAQFSPSFATGALFIDGVYVLNGGTSLSLMDLERVEVIKGPQSAYFARNTFGGAVNLITRDPNAEEFGGEITASMSDRGRTDISGLIEGPIIKDVLAFSVSGRFYDKEGHFTATDGGRTGDEETTTFNGVINWTPTDNFKLKMRYSTSEDDDGAPSQGYVSGIMNDTCTGTTVNSAEGVANPVNYICGTVPYGNAVTVDPGNNIISSNTILPVDMSALTDPTTNIDGVPGITSIGMKRESERFTIAAGYQFDSGYSIDVSYGKNEQEVNWIRDFDLSDRLGWWSRDPQNMDDESWEIRFTSPQDQRLRWLVGYSYYEQEFLASGSGGDAATSCFAFDFYGYSDAYPDICVYSFFDPAIGGLGIGRPGNALGIFRNSLTNTDQAEVSGVFGSIDFDITDNLTVILEGRFVEDTLIKGNAVAGTGNTRLEEEFDDFLPRAIVRWTPSDNTTLYASWSEGQIAGDFNTFYAQADDREKAQYIAQDSTVAELLDAETLEAIEFGWKQRFWDGRGQMNIAVYMQTWENIKGRSSFLINETCRASDIGSAQCPDGTLGQPKGTYPADGSDPVPFFNSRNILIPGDADIWGVEFEGKAAITDRTEVGVNISYIESEYDDYTFNFVAPIAGFSQMSGNQTPRQPKNTMSAYVSHDFSLLNQGGYWRLDWFHQGESYVDESNLAKLDSYNLFNLRIGLEWENLMAELFVMNLTDEEAWQTGARWTDFSSPSQFAFLTAKQGVAVSPLDKREVGLRVNWKF